MAKYLLSILLLLMIMAMPGIVKADELPPGDEIIITAPPGLPAFSGQPELNDPVVTTEIEPGNMAPVPETGSTIVIPSNGTAPTEGINTGEAPKITEPVPTANLVPVITERLLAEYTTWLIKSPANRNHNINQALLAINGQIIKPGSTWSFNQVVGPRTTTRGYKSAMIIVNKKFVPGIGGGVCQVASTLYNVLIAVKFKVLERHPHSLPVTYVARGRDAAVSYGHQDLKFINTLNQEVLIKTKLQTDRVAIAFYTREPGTPMPKPPEILLPSP